MFQVQRASASGLAEPPQPQQRLKQSPTQGALIGTNLPRVLSLEAACRTRILGLSLRLPLPRQAAALDHQPCGAVAEVESIRVLRR